MQPKPLPNHKPDTRREFHHPPRLLLALLIGGLISLGALFANLNQSSELSPTFYIIALVAGLLVTGIFIASRSSKVICIKNGQLYYGQNKVDLSLLTDVSTVATHFWAGRIFNIYIYVVLTDRSGAKVRIPLGDWDEQNDLLCAISGYASNSGAVVSKRAEKLLEKARNNMS